MENYTAWLFTLGTELTQGRVVNTNATFICRRLTLIGFNVVGVITLIDDVDLISRYLRIVLSWKPRVLITTGGLGPTYDDRTLEAIAKAVNKQLVINQEAFEMVKKRYEARGLDLTPERIKMAYLPEEAIPIPNSVGTAPGCWLEVENTSIIALPGVPKEMEVMWFSWVEPRLRLLGPNLHIVERLIVVEDVPEATMAPVIKVLIKLYPGVYIKTHPEISEIGKPVLKIYVMYSHRDEEQAKSTVLKVIQGISDKFMEMYGSKPKVIAVKEAGELTT